MGFCGCFWVYSSISSLHTSYSISVLKSTAKKRTVVHEHCHLFPTAVNWAIFTCKVSHKCPKIEDSLFPKCSVLPDCFSPLQCLTWTHSLLSSSPAHQDLGVGGVWPSRCGSHVPHVGCRFCLSRAGSLPQGSGQALWPPLHVVAAYALRCECLCWSRRAKGKLDLNCLKN